jgi:hypothetical protein
MRSGPYRLSNIVRITPRHPPHTSGFQDLSREDGPLTGPDLDLGNPAGNYRQGRRMAPAGRARGAVNRCCCLSARAEGGEGKEMEERANEWERASRRTEISERSTPPIVQSGRLGGQW